MEIRHSVEVDEPENDREEPEDTRCGEAKKCRTETGRVATCYRVLSLEDTFQQTYPNGFLLLCLRCTKEMAQFPDLVCFTAEGGDCCIDCRKKKRDYLLVSWCH